MSKRASFTPGPWTIDWNVARLDVFSADASRLVATLRRSALSSVIDSSAIANARLIAAAPELLEALQEMQHAFNVNCDQLVGYEKNAIAKARAAIAKATGEQS